MNKQWYKDRIYGYQCKVVEILSTYLHLEPKRKVLNRCRQLLNSYTVLLQLSTLERHTLWNWTVSAYTRTSKKSWGDRSKIPEATAKLFKSTEHTKNEVADQIEFRYKHDRAMDYIRSQQTFYRLSTHENCAEGHLAYQGQIFINEDNANEEEKAFAEKHNIQTIREVMFDDPWLTTRNNCKHIFEPIPSELVLTNSLPPVKVRKETPLNSPYRAYYDRRKLLVAAGISKKNDSYKRTVMLMRKYR